MFNEQLEKLIFPDVFCFTDGRKVTGKEQWAERRKEIQNIICAEEYGFLPPVPINLHWETIYADDTFCAGKAELLSVKLTAELQNGKFSFPVNCVLPKTGRPCPAFLHINFRDSVPDKYMPSEELCDNGFAVVSFCYTDVTSDDGDFTNGLAGAIYKGSEKTADSPGKIALWAWAVMRVMDYMQTLDSIDKKNIAVAGHSRLGKTALLAGALDERFAFIISNDSGCSGAALSRGKTGEKIKDICHTFPYWFCENYKKYVDNEESLPFDQHFLLSLAAPRKLYISSANGDAWADPKSEFLSCVAAGEVYEFLGEIGFIYPDRSPLVNESLHSGSIGYHLREGLHYFSRYDWLRFIEYILKYKT